MSRMIKEALETMRELEQVGVVSKQTLRDFEAQAVPPPAYTAEAIRRLREHLHVSQAVFAAYLNASVSTVQKWENGEKKPSGAALRLLSSSSDAGWKYWFERGGRNRRGSPDPVSLAVGGCTNLEAHATGVK